jgi:signal transduction histidine kinase
MLPSTTIAVSSTFDRPLHCEATVVDVFVAEVLDSYPLAGGIEMCRDLDCADQIFADHGAMQQVLVSLLDNAVHSLQDPDWQRPAGHRPQCMVSTQFITTHVLLTIGDNGPGIARERLPSLFDTDAGLPLARQIVEQHGGTLDVHSDVGQGTTVTVWLPRHRAARPMVRIAAAAA